ncbi:UDP-N-acetylmuramoyl-L-alanine--D-glutamate ligase [Frateuria aurantia]
MAGGVLTAGGRPLTGRRVLVWGFGREGRAVLDLLRRQAPTLQPAVLCSESEVVAVQAFAPGLEVLSGAVTADLLASYEVIIKSPGISAYIPALLEAQRRGSVLTSGTALWFGRHPEARVVAVTGTKGKSTTSAMLAHLARALGVATVLAGNIGLPLLELDDLEAELWVLELSSFQTREAGPLELAVIVSLYEEHLDWHGSRQRYVDDKLALADQARQLLLPASSAVLQQRFSGRAVTSFGQSEGWHIRDGAIWRSGQPVLELALLPLQGLHNALNACAALTALEMMGYDAVAAAPALADFHPLPHRLQRLGRSDGFDWINDSICTTPEATLAALQSLQGQPVSVIVGGYDRGLDWSHFVIEVMGLAPELIVTQGANGPRIAAALREAGYPGPLSSVDTLDQAVAAARRLSRPGTCILLSPGAPSFDQFVDYAARGRHFAQLAGFTAKSASLIEGLGLS